MDASGILGGLGFSEGPLGVAAPEEARGEINYRGPQGEQGAAAGQKKQDCGDTLKRIRQTADGGASKPGADGFGDRCAFFTQRERDVCEGDAAAGSKTLRFARFQCAAGQPGVQVTRNRRHSPFDSGAAAEFAVLRSAR